MKVGATKMSGEVIAQLLTISGTLVGVVVGGFITTLSARSIERLKWQHERLEKLASLKREALAAALEWISPMRNAEIRASSLVLGAIHGDIDYEQFLNEFPYLVGDLVNKDLSAYLSVLLPEDIYIRGHNIVRSFEKLRFLGVKNSQEVRRMGTPMIGFEECNNALQELKEQIDSLEMDMQRMYRETFQ
ncbi:MAG: hypothetical protein ACYC6A_03380 [Armatimonadota bacterium]